MLLVRCAGPGSSRCQIHPKASWKTLPFYHRHRHGLMNFTPNSPARNFDLFPRHSKKAARSSAGL